MKTSLNSPNKVYGHHDVVDSLEESLPRFTMLVGPRSIGKKTIYAKALVDHGIEETFEFSEVTENMLEDLRVLTSGTMSGQRMIFIRYGYPTKKHVERLLKIVEDATEGVNFFITSTHMPEFTLASRFTVFSLGYLRDADISMILIRKGYDPKFATELATKGFGTVRETIYSAKVSSDTYQVFQALKYIEEHDPASLEQLHKKWSDTHTSLIKTWAIEKITNRFRMFDPDKHDILNKKVALEILRNVDPFDRPRYVVRNSLVEVCVENSK